MKSDTKQTFSVAQIAERWGTCFNTPLAHIKSGELPAFDISTNRAGRSRYVIRREDLEAFEEGRTVAPPSPKQNRRQEKTQRVPVEEFIR